jgi:hypothetical protein
MIKRCLQMTDAKAGKTTQIQYIEQSDGFNSIQKLYLKTIHSNTNNTSSIELLNRLSNNIK